MSFYSDTLSWPHSETSIWSLPWLSKSLSTPYEGYSRSASCAQNVISTFLLRTLGRYFCWWIISPRGYHPLSSRGTNMALTWLIRYMYCRNLQFLNNVIKNKANVLLPQTYVTVTDSGYPIQALCLYCFQSLLLFGLTIFRF